MKLLRLLQDREFERLGGNQTLKSTARFVAATHQPLEELIKKRAFREDLFYRLNVLPIWIPALRARAGDVESLARHFCRQFGDANGRGPLELAPDALALLQQQAWPGNVRELQNFIERLVVLSDGDTLTAARRHPGAGAAAAGGRRRRRAREHERATGRRAGRRRGNAGGEPARRRAGSDHHRARQVREQPVEGGAPARHQPPRPVPQARRARAAVALDGISSSRTLALARESG